VTSSLTQAAGVQHLQHGAIALAERCVHVRRLQQRLDLRLAQGLGYTQRLAGRLQAERGIGIDQPLAQSPAEVTLEDGETAVGGGGARLPVTGRKIGVEIGLGGFIQLPPLLRQPGGIQMQVAPVGRKRIAREAVLQPQRVDEAVDARLAR
jgi:hypothetical protein